MPQENLLNQSAQTQTSEQSLEANQSVLTPEQTAFIEGKVAELSGKFQVIDAKDATVTSKEPYNAQIAGIINDIFSNADLEGVEYKVFTDLNKLNSKNVQLAIKQLKLPALAEGASEEDQTGKQAKLEAVVKELTGIKQEKPPMGSGGKAVLWTGLAIVSVVGAIAAPSYMNEKAKTEGERKATVATQFEVQGQVNDVATQNRINNFNAGRMTITNAEIFNELVPGGNFKNNQDVVLKPDQLIMLNAKGITVNLIATFYNSKTSIETRNEMMIGTFGDFIKSVTLPDSQ